MQIVSPGFVNGKGQKPWGGLESNVSPSSEERKLRTFMRVAWGQVIMNLIINWQEFHTNWLTMTSVYNAWYEFPNTLSTVWCKAAVKCGQKMIVVIPHFFDEQQVHWKEGFVWFCSVLKCEDKTSTIIYSKQLLIFS